MHVNVTPEVALKNELARRSGTSPQDWYLVLKARYGMESAFTGLRTVAGEGAVVSQIFTCATAVNPILTAGLTPRYAEIDPNTFAIDPSRLRLGTDDRAVMIQNTFGVVSDEPARATAERARAAGAVVFEDSAHAVGRMARGTDGSPLADVSIHSFGVEKLLPTKFGGAIWLSPTLQASGYTADVRAAMARELQNIAAPSARQSFAARSYRNQLRVITRLPGRLGGVVRGAMIKAGLFDPPISAQESRGHQAAPVGMSSWVASTALTNLQAASRIEAQRSRAVAVYASALAGSVLMPAGASGESEAAPLVRFPFYVRDASTAEHMISELSRQGVPAGRWYRPALFPGAQDPSVYGYEPGSPDLAISEDAIARVVNLPTNVEPERAAEIAEMVKRIVAG